MLLIRAILRARIKAVNERLRADVEALADLQSHLNVCRLIANEVEALAEQSPAFKGVFFQTANFNEHSWLQKIQAHPGTERLRGLLRELAWRRGGREGSEIRVAIKAYLSTQIKPQEVENLAFAGGGAKGLSYGGVLEVLEAEGAMANIKRVSGTSAGAIIGMTVAVGLTAAEVKDVIRDKKFTHFLFESPFNRPEQLPPHLAVLDMLTDIMSPRKRELMRDADYLKCYKVAFEEAFFPRLLTATGAYTGNAAEDQEEAARMRKLLCNPSRFGHDEKKTLLDLIEDKDWFKSMHTEIEEKLDKQLRVGKKRYWFFGEKIAEYNGFDSPREAADACIRYMRNEDSIEEFFGDLIQRQVSRLSKEQLEAVSHGLSQSERQRNLTFRELHALAKHHPELGFRDLYVCVARRKDNSMIKMLDKDNYERIDVSHAASAEYRNMPVKTAVRMSMNIPGAFRSIEFNGKHYVDGGVRANFPVDVFDNHLGLPKNKTISFFLTPEENYLRATSVQKLTNPDSSEIPLSLNPFAYVAHYAGLALGRLMKDFQCDVLNDNRPMQERDFRRMMSVNVRNLATQDFDASRAEIEAIQRNGAVAARAVFKPGYDVRVHYHLHRITLLQRQSAELQARYESWAYPVLLGRVRDTAQRWVSKILPRRAEPATEIDMN